MAQEDAVIENIIQEAENNSQLEDLAHELLDEVGPRLVGTPQMLEAHNWAIEKFGSWGIPAEKQQWGEWKGWERGITHIDFPQSADPGGSAARLESFHQKERGHR